VKPVAFHVFRFVSFARRVGIDGNAREGCKCISMHLASGMKEATQICDIGGCRTASNAYAITARSDAPPADFRQGFPQWRREKVDFPQASCTAIFGCAFQMRYAAPASGRKMDGLWRFAAPLSFSVAAISKEGPATGSYLRRNRQMPTGTVKFFNESKGFGFIQPEDGGQDAFVHISDVERSGMSTLKENQRVSYDVEDDQRGKKKATNLKSADGE
jgi:CspA family cold shock protein